MAVESVTQISAESTSSNFRVEKLEDVFEFTLKSTAANMFRYCLIAFFMGSILATTPFKFTHQFFLSATRQPNSGLGRLIVEDSRSYPDTHTR